MGLSLGSLQILASLNLTTEQMAGVVQVLTVELAPLEERRAKDRTRKILGRRNAENPRTQVLLQSADASRIPSSSLSETTEIVREEIPPINPPIDFFDAFWSAYPKRAGSRDRKAAVKAFRAATKRAAPADIIEGALQYANYCRLTDKENTEFVKQARSWLNADGWTETYEISRRPNPNGIHDNWAIASAVLAEQDRREGICREGSEDDLRPVSEPEGWPRISG